MLRVCAFAFLGSVFFLFTSTAEASVTYRLWTRGEFRGDCRPAPEPRLRLHESPQGKDVVVIYDELSERNGNVQERAYLLRANAARLARGKRPRFLKPAQYQFMAGEVAYDLISGPDAIPSFRIRPYSPDRQSSFAGEIFSLPLYRDHTGYPALAALTPLAVAADASIVGFCLGLLGLYSYAQGFNYR